MTSPLTCYDCPLPYGDPGWCDAVIPDAIWAQIAPKPDGGGVLCVSCIARRLAALGMQDVPLMITSGPFIHMPQRPYEVGDPLTKYQHAVYEFVSSRILADGYAPSFEEIASHFGYRSLATVHEHLKSLTRKGWLRREFNIPRGIALVAA